MSKRDDLMKKANILGIAYLVIGGVLVVFIKSIPMPLNIIIMVAYFALLIGAILIFNSMLYKQGKQLFATKENVKDIQFQVPAQVKQVVVDVIWEIKAGMFQVNNQTCRITIETPDGATTTDDLLASNVTTPGTAYSGVQTQLNVYQKDNYQHTINNPAQGNYAIHLDIPSAESGFSIQKITVTAWE